MDKKDKYIKQKLQQDKDISNKANNVFKNFKGGNQMDNKEKRTITISFNKFMAIAASFVIILFVGVGLYINVNKTKSTNDKEVISKLAMEDTAFIVKDIKEKDGKYEVTAQLLNDTKKEISEDEYNKILNGEKIKFRGVDWKYNEEKTKKTGTTYIQSGENELTIKKEDNTNKYYLENATGSQTGGLCDFSEKTVKFETKEISDYILNNYKDNQTDSYGECKATIENGEVISIKSLENDESKCDYFVPAELIGKVFQTEYNDNKEEIIIKEIKDNIVKFEYYIYRNETFNLTATLNGNVATFSLDENELAGEIVLSNNKITLSIKETKSDSLKLGSREFSKNIKYEDYIGGVWQFQTEDDGITELEIKDIKNGKITFKLYTYRSETYEEQTVSFGHETASEATFTVTKGDSTVNGIIILKPGKVAIKTQGPTRNGVLKEDSYYESSAHIKYEDYINGVWNFDNINGSEASVYISNIETGKVSFIITKGNNSYEFNDIAFYYDTASILHFENGAFEGQLALKDNKEVALYILSEKQQVKENKNNKSTDSKIYEKYENADVYWLFRESAKREYVWQGDKIEIKDDKLYVKGNLVNIEGTPYAFITWGDQTLERIYVLTNEGTVWKLLMEGKGEKLNSSFEKVNIAGKVIDMTNGNRNTRVTEPPYFLLETGELVNEAGEKYERLDGGFVNSFGNEYDRIYVKSDNSLAYFDTDKRQYVTIKDENGNVIKMKNAYVQWTSFDGTIADGASERLFVVTEEGKLMYFDGYNTDKAKEYEKAKNKIVKGTRERKEEVEYSTITFRIIEFTDGTELELQDTTENFMQN